jgi:hypothetical protein
VSCQKRILESSCRKRVLESKFSKASSQKRVLKSELSKASSRKRLLKASPQKQVLKSEFLKEAKDNSLNTIGSLDNEALAALAQRSPKSSKYNFYPDFGKCFFKSLSRPF